MNQGSYNKEPDWQSKADARLEKWLKQKKDEKRCAKQHGAFNLQSKDDKINRGVVECLQTQN